MRLMIFVFQMAVLFPVILPAGTRASNDIAFKIRSVYLEQAERIDARFRHVYKPTWMGAFGLIGQAYLYRLTKDRSYSDFALNKHDILKLDNGEWVDDVAWVSLAILHWWDATGRTNRRMIKEVQKRYDQAKKSGLLSSESGYWTWYNIPRRLIQGQKRFANSNMNQMISVACWLFGATGDKKYLSDALMVWEGESHTPGIEKRLYRGNGRWEGRPGPAASGGEIPFYGAEYASIAAALYTATKREKYRQIAVETVRYVMNPENDWVDRDSYCQKYIDGNGVFVNSLYDAYSIAPVELSDIPGKCKKMLDRVWSNANGRSKVVLHRLEDDGIRHGWTLHGGEDGYFPDDIGTTLAQGEALRAWGVVAFYDK